jgi:hypothetical protein
MIENEDQYLQKLGIPQEEKDRRLEAYKLHLDLDYEAAAAADDRANDQDPDFKPNCGNFGKLIERYIADNVTCPICNRLTLRMYKSECFPVIDFACINDEHTFANGVKFFQIKTSNGEPFRGTLYFDLLKHEIHVGTSLYATAAHSIKTISSPNDKNILLGYICLIYRENEDSIIILRKHSLAIIPDRDISGRNEFYYTYDEPNKRITYNNELCIKYKISNDIRIPKDYNNNYTEIQPHPTFI